MTEEQPEEVINLLEYWNVLWRRKIMIISLCFVVVTAALVVSLLSPKYYESVTLIITSGSDSGGLGAALSSLPIAGMLGGIGGQTPADKIVLILKSRTIAEMVIRKFDLQKVFNDKKWDAINGSWKNPGKPPLMENTVSDLNGISKFNKSKEGAITVSVEWKDPQLAADIANYYVYALTDFLKDKSMNITVQVVDKAVPAEQKSRPKVVLNVVFAGITSLFIGVFIVLFLESLEKQKNNAHRA